MGSRKRGRAARKARKSAAAGEPEELVKAPHSFVIYRGVLGRNASALLFDFRNVMEPYTASQLKVQKRNSLNDFVAIAGPLNVTHLIIFTKSKIAMYVRIVRLPRGPTLTFRVNNYTLSRDVVSSQKHPVVYSQLFTNSPLLVLNNFSEEGMHIKIMASMFQNMFPSINVHKVQLDTIKRCVLFNYNPEQKTLDFRHYTIKVAPYGMSKPVKNLIQSKVPNLSKCEDFSDYIMNPGNLSESETEEPQTHLMLPQPISGRGNIPTHQSSIKLVELGPRMTWQLVKIEEGIMDKRIIFHTIGR